MKSRAFIIFFALFFCFLSTPLMSENNTQGPTYVNGLFLIGEAIVEFALSGNRTYLIEQLEPFVYNGRLHFFCFALPVTSGQLHNGSFFQIEFMNLPRLFAVYRGNQSALLNPATPLPVRGFATKGGQLVITHIFFNLPSVNEFLRSVPLAFN